VGREGMGNPAHGRIRVSVERRGKRTWWVVDHLPLRKVALSGGRGGSARWDRARSKGEKIYEQSLPFHSHSGQLANEKKSRRRRPRRFTKRGGGKNWARSARLKLRCSVENDRKKEAQVVASTTSLNGRGRGGGKTVAPAVVSDRKAEGNSRPGGPPVPSWHARKKKKKGKRDAAVGCLSYQFGREGHRHEGRHRKKNSAPASLVHRTDVIKKKKRKKRAGRGTSRGYTDMLVGAGGKKVRDRHSLIWGNGQKKKKRKG